MRRSWRGAACTRSSTSSKHAATADAAGPPSASWPPPRPRGGPGAPSARQDLPGGGGDCAVKGGPDTAVYVAHLQASGSLIRKPVDDGKTFPASSATEDPIEQDRQWLAPDPADPRIVY